MTFLKGQSGATEHKHGKEGKRSGYFPGLVLDSQKLQTSYLNCDCGHEEKVEDGSFCNLYCNLYSIHNS